ncbi:SRPBCC family protein [Dinghuibacter silviterrae]|uniref:Uncharacterized protein YndB with AHSA1/START domain n=1 Tax=Dinghuibacter silviterrae TaxID=1539049 RepID=A0A4R8DUI7_9BACT|nr:SRPBCC domain-containing protein [Dinghuibacter silviterrae]TDX02034.1 uncharacterized protein YndB with AHSA1/START domain [Dinghuibacter silviterrae]
MTIERIYDSPVTDVWQAITRVDLLRQWYFQIPEFRAEVGFAFSFAGTCETKPNVHLCEVTEVVPGKKLAYTWRYEGEEGLSLVTYELFPEGENTRLRLTHEGLESFSAEVRKAKNVESGWAFLLNTALPEFLQKQAV